jgi:hypothetical protein
MPFPRFLAYLMVASLVAGVLLNLTDIKRYIKISTM